MQVSREDLENKNKSYESNKLFSNILIEEIWIEYDKQFHIISI